MKMLLQNAGMLKEFGPDMLNAVRWGKDVEKDEEWGTCFV